ncbi:MAG: formate/nitrite transporter family protein [Candidatus Eremiobacteraeota bacterium]|nr:formate/nitrite transporter family protein [Candidatus Eremiobacteraeota bacterium]
MREGRLIVRNSTESNDGETTKQLSEQEVREAKRRGSPRAAVVLESVRLEGQQELERPNASLAFSGLAAGLSMGFSLVATGMLHAALPDVPWRGLIENLGYTLGFLIVVAGRQQLFTENTVTAIIPLLDNKDRIHTFGNVVRLWSIVLATNLIGALLFALLVFHTGAFAPDVKRAFLQIGETTLSYGFGSTLVKGIFAGWLIALMVWLLPAAEHSRLAVVIIITYVVGAAGLSHIIAGSVEALYAVVAGAASWTYYFVDFLIPVFIGNCIGGVLLVSILNYAQVAPESLEAGEG